MYLHCVFPVLDTSHDASMDVPSRVQLLKRLICQLLRHPARITKPSPLCSAPNSFTGGTCWCFAEHPVHLRVHSQAAVMQQCQAHVDDTGTYPASRPPEVWGSNNRGHSLSLAASPAFPTSAAAFTLLGSSELATPLSAQCNAPSMMGMSSTSSWALTCNTVQQS